MALNVIGESGVRIRPVTSGFVPELQAYIDNTSGRVAAEIPLSIGSVQLQGAIDDLKSSAAGGAVLPIELARKGVDAGLADIRKTAEAGADFALRAQGGALEQTISDAKSTTERGAVMPLTASDVDLQASIADAKAAAEVGADMPLFPGESAVEAALGMLRGSAEAGASFPIVLDADQAIGELARFQDAVRGSSTSVPLDTSGVVGELGQAQNAASQFGSQFGGVLDNLNGQIAGLGGGVGGLGRKLVGLLSSPGGALLGGGAIAGAFGAANVLSAGNQRLTRIEDSTAALEIQLGGAKQAADLVADVLKTVNGTPFTLDQFVEAARTLVTFGTEAKEIPKYLTAIGEAAAGSGRGIEAVGTITDVFSKIQITGRATTDDWQRLGGVGVDALTIWGNASGKTTAEMQALVTDGAVPAKEAIDQLIEGITNGSNGVAGKVNKLGGSMEKLRNTFSGASGGLQAASARFGVALLQPFRDSTIKLIQNATTALDKLGPVVRTTRGEVANSDVLQSFIASIGTLPSKLGPVLSVVSDVAREALKFAERAAGVGAILYEGLAPVATFFAGTAGAAIAALAATLSDLFGVMERNEGTTKAIAAALATIFVVSKVTSWASAVLGAIRRTTAFAIAQNTVRAATAGTNQQLLRQLQLQNQLAIAEGRRAAASGVQGATDVAGAAASAGGVGDLVGAASDATALSAAAADAASKTKAIGEAAQEAEGFFRRSARGIANGASNLGNALFELAGGWVGVLVGAVAVAGLTLKYFYDQWKKQAAERAAERVEPLGDITDNATTFAARLQAQKKFNDDLNRIKAQADGVDTLTLTGTIGLAGLGGGVLGSDVTGGLQTWANTTLPGASQALDFFTNRTIDATTAQTDLQTRLQADDALRNQTQGYGALAESIRNAGTEYAQLGLKRETDTKKIAENQAVLEEALTRSIDPNLDGAEREAAVQAARINSTTLAQFSYESLLLVQDALGLSMEEIASKSGPELTAAIEEAAQVTIEAAAAATGLSSNMARVAGAYNDAKKAAQEYTSLSNAQVNSWLGGVVAADNYDQALNAIVYSSDFTAKNLQAVAQAEQAVVESAYETALAQATLSGSTDAVGDAAKAAAVKDAELREQWIQTQMVAGKTRAEAEQLATAILGIPGSKVIDIILMVNDAALKTAQANLDRLQADAAGGTGLGTVFANSVQIPFAKIGLDNAKAQGDYWKFLSGVALGEQQKAQQAVQDQLVSTQEQQAAQQAREDAKRAAEEAAREAERAAEEARREAERLAEEEKRRREKELQDFLQMVQGIRNASENMITSFEKMIDTFREKRRELIGDITKRVEFGQTTSVARLIKNADQRNTTLAESQKGLADLRKRGLSEDAIKSIGLTGKSEDARAIRRLLKASPEELKALSASVGKLGETATQAAYREQGQIIGREIRDVLEAWTETPGVRNPNVTITQIAQWIRDANGDSEQAASRIGQRLGGTVKR